MLMVIPMGRRVRIVSYDLDITQIKEHINKTRSKLTKQH